MLKKAKGNLAPHMNHLVDKKLYQIKRNLHYLNPQTRPKKILFDHIPKCAGSSFHQYLTPFYPQRKIFTVDGANPQESLSAFKSLSQNQRHKFSLVKGHFAHELIDYASPEAILITILRDPYTRVCSLYHFINKSPRHRMHQLVFGGGMSLTEFALSGLPEATNWITSYFSGLDSANTIENPEEAYTKALLSLKKYHVAGTLSDLSLFSKNLAISANLRYPFDGRIANQASTRQTLSEPEITSITETNDLDIRLYREITKLIDSGYFRNRELDC